MTQYFYRTILIHGSEPCRNEKIAYCVYVVALFVAVMAS